MSTLQTTPTQYIKATNGVTFAYRRLNPINSKRTPLLLHIHFRANMDFWDPLLINTLALHRPIIIFDNSGVGRSTGTIRTTYQGWAENLISFVRALDLTQIDLLGFSMGGCAVQQVALTAPDLIRMLIMAGSGTSEPSPTSDVSGIIWPRETPPPEPITALATAVNPAETQASLALSFFYDDPAGRAHFSSYWSRILERDVPSEPNNTSFVDVETSKRQSAAYVDWTIPNPANAYDRLGELQMPVLVVNGDHDVLIPTSASWEMHKRIPNSELIVYPKAGHGFIWQYAERFAEDLRGFLDGEVFENNLAKE
jgi:pimeloyl-ACP methyl ester carboxylesterase